MIVEFSMLLESLQFKLKYEQVIQKQRTKFTLSPNLAYMVKVTENYLSIVPLVSYECGTKQLNVDMRLGTFDIVRNVPCPNEVEMLAENQNLHILICALLARDIDNDQFVKGLKLDHNFDHAPCKFINNYLTGGFVFRGYDNGSYDTHIDFGEFLIRWAELLVYDFHYQFIRLEPLPETIAGRLKAYR